MTMQSNLQSITLLAAADLSAKQFYGVKVDSNGKAALAGAGDMCIGVLQNKPESGQAATVAYGGRTKMVAGGNVTAGTPAKTDSAGKAATASKATVDTSNTGSASDAVVGSNVIGIFLTSGVANDLVEVMLLPLGAVPTTAA